MVIKRPTECLNACCGAMCSAAYYQLYKGIFGDNPRKCPNYAFYEAPSRSEVKNGKWIFKQRHKNVDVCCSECGYIRIVDYAYGYTVEQLEARNAMEEVLAKGDLKFCENCGAKMENKELQQGLDNDDATTLRSAT